jgi:hypothetical protein
MQDAIFHDLQMQRKLQELQELQALQQQQQHLLFNTNNGNGGSGAMDQANISSVALQRMQSLFLQQQQQQRNAWTNAAAATAGGGGNTATTLSGGANGLTSTMAALMGNTNNNGSSFLGGPFGIYPNSFLLGNTDGLLFSEPRGLSGNSGGMQTRMGTGNGFPSMTTMGGSAGQHQYSGLPVSSSSSASLKKHGSVGNGVSSSANALLGPAAETTLSNAGFLSAASSSSELQKQQLQRLAAEGFGSPSFGDLGLLATGGPGSLTGTRTASTTGTAYRPNHNASMMTNLMTGRLHHHHQTNPLSNVALLQQQQLHRNSSLSSTSESSNHALLLNNNSLSSLDSSSQQQQQRSSSLSNVLLQQQAQDADSFAGGWQSNSDIPDRRLIIQCILQIIQELRPNSSRLAQKYVVCRSIKPMHPRYMFRWIYIILTHHHHYRQNQIVRNGKGS